MNIRFLGATQQVTGSCYLVHANGKNVLLDCGLQQGSPIQESKNSDKFDFEAHSIDALILSHAHIDHSGRIPLLTRRGFTGPIHTHYATADLCRIMLADSGYLNERETFWQNKKRERKGLAPLKPLYTRDEALESVKFFKGMEYEKPIEILPGMILTLFDAGHILGSAIIQLELSEKGRTSTIVFSGDLGHAGAPILRPPKKIKQADLIVMESTYGDRMHRPWDETWLEIEQVLHQAKSDGGNVLIPAFAVGRSQELLYLFKRNYENWAMDRWHIFLDSPMAIETTKVYGQYSNTYNATAKSINGKSKSLFDIPNLHYSLSTKDSIAINNIRSGAIILAGSGMCTGGRIKHHLKHNAWRRETHVLIVGFQAEGTLGRKLVNGTKFINLWGESISVNANIHTINGLSAHADQQGLLNWLSAFNRRNKISLVHGESKAMETLSYEINYRFNIRPSIATKNMLIEL